MIIINPRIALNRKHGIPIYGMVKSKLKKPKPTLKFNSMFESSKPKFKPKVWKTVKLLSMSSKIIKNEITTYIELIAILSIRMQVRVTNICKILIFATLC